MNGKIIIYSVKEKFEVCDYNPQCFISMGWIIYDIIVDLFMNVSRSGK